MHECVVLDLFCGVGGFSLGAVNAGARVAVAVDVDEKCLRVHAENHKKTQHWLHQLGSWSPRKTWQYLTTTWGDEWRGKHVHIHGSPPCQNLSTIHPSPDVDEGLRLVIWFLELIRLSNCHSWSMEQVPHPRVLEILKKRNIEHAVINMQHFGVPQTRVRCIAGAGWHHAGLAESRFPSPRKFFMRTMGWSAPKCEHVRMCPFGGKTETDAQRFNSNRARSLDQPGFTLIRTYPFYIVENVGRGQYIRRPLSVSECLWFQTFPSTFRFSAQMTVTMQRGMIGNAIPPMIARSIIQEVTK